MKVLEMDNSIKLSIILITYNHEKYISDAIERVLQQPIRDRYELLIGDDCSSDGTKEIISQYAAKYPEIIKVVYHEKNVGAARNIYDLLIQTRGKYILRLEGDNYWEKTDQIQKMIDFLDQHEEFIGMAYQSKTIDEETGDFIHVSKVDPRIKDNIATLKDFEKGHRIGCLFYRNFYREKEKDYSIIYTGGRMIAETTLLLLVLEHGKVYVTDKNWEVSRGGKRDKGASNYQSITKRQDILEEWLHNAEVLQEYRPDLSLWSKKIFPAGEMLWDAVRVKDIKRVKVVLNRFSLKEKIILLMNLIKRVIRHSALKLGKLVRVKS